jgi:protein SCO1/2
MCVGGGIVMTMWDRLGVIVFMWILSSVTAEEYITLPFYDEPTLTPRWIGEAESESGDYHRIVDFELTNQNGKSVTAQSLRGSIYVANFFFTTCPGICSSMTKNLKHVQDAFEDEQLVKLVSYSVTPEFDTPEVLKAYESKHVLSDDLWHLLTGDKALIYRLARDSYFADEDLAPIEQATDQFLHTEKVFLIDGEGRIRGVYNGAMTVDMKRVIADVKTLQAQGE